MNLQTIFLKYNKIIERKMPETNLKELAADLDIPAATLWRQVNGVSKMTLETYMRLEKFGFFIEEGAKNENEKN